MQTKTIDKLEDLNGFEWEYKGKKFKIYDPECFPDKLMLATIIISANTGKDIEKDLFPVGLKNVKELEFYELKIIINEKPKLTKEDKEFLEKDFYVTRDTARNLFLFFEKPIQNQTTGLWDSETSLNLYIEEDRLFPFITWDSGKAWSKAELMELEVID